VEGARRLFLECEQTYAKVFGSDHEETLNAAMCTQTVCEEKEDKEGEERDSDEECECVWEGSTAPPPRPQRVPAIRSPSCIMLA
jgi:hypothetical protein